MKTLFRHTRRTYHTTKEGLSALTARRLGKSLDCSASSIFTVFPSMVAVKMATRELALGEFKDAEAPIPFTITAKGADGTVLAAREFQFDAYKEKMLLIITADGKIAEGELQ